MQNTLIYDALIAHARPIAMKKLSKSRFFIEEQGIDVTNHQGDMFFLNV